MKNLRWILPSLGLAAALGTGCIIISGQIFAHFALLTPIVLDSTVNPVHREDVDLSTVKEYKDNKDKLKGLSDIAVVGKITNQSGPAGAVEIWITANATTFATVAEVQSGAQKLWGPSSIGAAPATHDLTWDESAKLFNAVGKKILIDEALGDGTFTIYVITTGAGPNTIQVDNGQLILTIDAGK